MDKNNERSSVSLKVPARENASSPSSALAGAATPSARSPEDVPLTPRDTGPPRGPSAPPATARPAAFLGTAPTGAERPHGHTHLPAGFRGGARSPRPGQKVWPSSGVTSELCRSPVPVRRRQLRRAVLGAVMEPHPPRCWPRNRAAHWHKRSKGVRAHLLRHTPSSLLPSAFMEHLRDHGPFRGALETRGERPRS